MVLLYRNIFKRFFDIILSFLGLVLLSPILLITSLLLLISNKGKSIFFIQERPGKNGIVFKLIKFKTMTDKRDVNGNLLPGIDRLTKIGKFVRSTSIDEILQLVNVLKGDMSLIGPRPLLTQYLPLYSTFQLRRHEVLPGITGWAQVNGRNTISWQKKFEYDVWYVDNYSLSLDIKIFLLTILKIFKRADINSASDATMPTFTGNKEQRE